jgi:hypothetical protein
LAEPSPIDQATKQSTSDPSGGVIALLGPVEAGASGISHTDVEPEAAELAGAVICHREAAVVRNEHALPL